MPNVWPILRVNNQSLAHWVCENVVLLLAQAFVPAEPVIEEIALPFNAKLRGRIMFPITDDLDHLAVWRKREQRMEMIRHQKKDMYPPIAALLAKSYRVEQAGGDRRHAELVLPSGPTVDGDQPDRFIGAHPERWCMGK